MSHSNNNINDTPNYGFIPYNIYSNPNPNPNPNPQSQSQSQPSLGSSFMNHSLRFSAFPASSAGFRARSAALRALSAALRAQCDALRDQSEAFRAQYEAQLQARNQSYGQAQANRYQHALNNMSVNGGRWSSSTHNYNFINDDEEEIQTDNIINNGDDEEKQTDNIFNVDDEENQRPPSASFFMNPARIFSALIALYKSQLQNINQSHGSINVDDEEKQTDTKRARIETSGPTAENEQVLAPLNNNINIDQENYAGVTSKGKTKVGIDVGQEGGLSGNSQLPAQTSNGVKSQASYPRFAFVSPNRSKRSNFGNLASSKPLASASTKKCLDSLRGPDGQLPQKLRSLDPRLIEKICNEIMDGDPNVRWDDIAGLDHAKKCVTEMAIWPLLRPDIFKGCRSPGRGILLFGPPGTGKTMIGKAIAGESKATFFNISASSLTSKWIGEGEKLVRALFGVARCRQPAVIFIDEIDSLLCQRKSHGEHEASRKLKTQLLIEMEGFDSGSEQILLIGATNRPQDLDEAARRRLTKRFYIPLPSAEARAWIVRNILNKDGLFKLSTEDIDNICKLTGGYSGSDMTNLVKEASMGPIREALKEGAEITNVKNEDMRPVTLQDFEDALHDVRPSVSLNEIGKYEEWNNQFGSLK